MNEEILKYLSENNVGVLAVEMLDGSPHAATLHFAHTTTPLSFIFKTSKSYRKSEVILKNGSTRASFVVGVTESDMRTMQVDGTLRITKDPAILDTYFAKFPEKKEKYEMGDQIILELIPIWWRYTNFKAPGGQKFISSTD